MELKLPIVISENEELKARIAQLEEEIKVSDSIIADRNRILAAFPCPRHGACVPYVLEVLEVLMPTGVLKMPDNWKNRTFDLRCATCMWYVEKSPSMTLGRCRRRAPTLNGWPTVFTGDWCGDHKLDETKIKPAVIGPGMVSNVS